MNFTRSIYSFSSKQAHTTANKNSPLAKKGERKLIYFFWLSSYHFAAIMGESTKSRISGAPS